MPQTIIDWDGEDLPSELRELPPGRYVVRPLDESEQLTPEEGAGIMAALDGMDAGDSYPWADVLRAIRDRARESEEQLWLRAAATSPSFKFLTDPSEDIYTLDDGIPFDDRATDRPPE